MSLSSFRAAFASTGRAPGPVRGQPPDSMRHRQPMLRKPRTVPADSRRPADGISIGFYVIAHSGEPRKRTVYLDISQKMKYSAI